MHIQDMAYKLCYHDQLTLRHYLEHHIASYQTVTGCIGSFEFIRMFSVNGIGAWSEVWGDHTKVCAYSKLGLT